SACGYRAAVAVSARTVCSCATTAAPSPIAAPSPTAKTPRTLDSSGHGRGRRSASGARGAACPVVRAIVPRPMDGAIDVLVRYGYVVVFGWVFAEQIGLPIPAAPVLLAAGALAGTGRLSLALVLVLAALASLGSDTIWYWI